MAALSLRADLPPSQGGLASYGPDFDDQPRRASNPQGREAGRPAGSLVINLKAAKALGLEVPLSLQASVDECRYDRGASRSSAVRQGLKLARCVLSARALPAN